MSNAIIVLTKKWWQFSKGNRPFVLLYVFFFFCSQAASFAEPLLIGWLLNTIQQSGLADIGHLLFIASLYIGLRVVFWLFHGPARVMEITNSFLVRANYKEYLVNGILSLPTAWHTDHHSGDSIDKVEKGTLALFQFSGITYEVIDTIVRFASSYIALIYFDLHASYIILLLVVMTVFIIVQFDKRVVPNYRTINRMENTVASKVYDVISNITTVIILRIEKLLLHDIVKTIQKPFALFKKNTMINETKWAVVSLMTAFMVFAVLASYLFQAYITGNVLFLGTIYILYGYIERINNLFYRFAFRYGDIVKWGADVANAQEIEEVFVAHAQEKKKKTVQSWKRITFSNIFFSYSGKRKRHLDGVSFSMKAGEKIAFIGESGSGKTTMLKILRGLYTPKSYGCIVDGENVEDGLLQLQDQIALIPQDPEIFNATIRHNITFGIEHTDKEIRRYTDMARFTKVIQKLPSKLESSIVEKGVNLSGGEKQRLALSRGLLHCEDKQLLLLDEPTSSVDPENELAIYKSILSHFKKQTVISTLHRLHLLPLFDTIYVFSNGKIVASGSYAELKKKSKLFNALLARKEIE